MDYKEKVQPFDVIVVFKSSSWFHRLVDKVTDMRAGHVALFIGGGIIVEATGSGIKKNKLKDYSSDSIVYLARPIALDLRQEQIILEYCNEVIGQRYSYLQLLVLWAKYVLGLKWVPDAERDAQVCSEFVANAFMKAGIEVIKGKKAHEIVPGDYLRSENFYVLYG